MKSILFGGVAAMALSAGALAADLPSRAAPIAPAPILEPMPVYSWTGFYAGLSAGAEITNNLWTTTLVAGGLPMGYANPHQFKQEKFRGALFAGYNWQVGPSWVTGLEADIGYNFGATKKVYGVPGTYTAAGGYPAGSTDYTSADVPWSGSVRARLGYLWTPSTMLYLTGGVAMAQADYLSDCRLATPGWCVGTFHEKHGSTRVGWTLGGGVETRLWGNWLGRAEYRYSDFGSKNMTFFAATPADTINVHTRLRTFTATLGLAYQFGGPAAAVVAKY